MGRSPRLTSFVVLRKKAIGGKVFAIGERLPAGFIPFAKIKQLMDHNILADTGTELGQESADRYSHAFVDKRDAPATD